MKSYYVALCPEKRLKNLIQRQKDLIEAFAGNQEYLSDPPHLSLYLFNSNNPPQIIKNLEDIPNSIKKIPIKINNLHVFYNDILTNGHTIAYGFDKQEAKILKGLQLKVVDSINNLKETIPFLLRESKSYEKMSDIEKANTCKYGFPYIGDNWIPHITIASIKKSKFEKVFEELKTNQIQGNFSLNSLNLYLIQNSKLIKSFKLLD